MGVDLPTDSFAHIGRTVQMIFMRFEAFSVGYHSGLDVYIPEAPTLITIQHAGENQKWCVFRMHPLLRNACRNAAQFSSQLETSRQQFNTESEMCDYRHSEAESTK